jgi:hypothetical protein
MQEMGLVNLSHTEAALRIARDLAREILVKGADPLKYKKDFLHLWITSHYARELQSVGNLEDDIYLANTIGAVPDDKIRNGVTERLKEFLAERANR